jgi:hypothetical protein
VLNDRIVPVIQNATCPIGLGRPPNRRNKLAKKKLRKARATRLNNRSIQSS